MTYPRYPLIRAATSRRNLTGERDWQRREAGARAKTLCLRLRRDQDISRPKLVLPSEDNEAAVTVSPQVPPSGGNLKRSEAFLAHTGEGDGQLASIAADTTKTDAATTKPVYRGSRFERAKRVVLGTLKLFMDPDNSPRCAGTAFFGFLSIFPAVGTVFLIYGLVADASILAETISSLRYILPGMALDILHEQLVTLASQPNTTLGIGLLISIPLALWSGSRGVDALLYAMSRVRGERPQRSFIQTALVSLGLTVVGSIFLVIALITVAGLPALIPFPSGEDWVLLAVRWPILMVVTIGVLACLYRWGPDRHPRKFRYIWPGALLASFLWILAGAVFSIYVENWGNYSATFGSVSAAVVLLLWLYNTAQILVLGAAFNAELQRENEPEAMPPRPEPERTSAPATLVPAAHQARALAQVEPAPRVRVSPVQRIQHTLETRGPLVGALVGLVIAGVATLVIRAADHDEATDS